MGGPGLAPACHPPVTAQGLCRCGVTQRSVGKLFSSWVAAGRQEVGRKKLGVIVISINRLVEPGAGVGRISHLASWEGT